MKVGGWGVVESLTVRFLAMSASSCASTSAPVFNGGAEERTLFSVASSTAYNGAPMGACRLLAGAKSGRAEAVRESTAVGRGRRAAARGMKAWATRALIIKAAQRTNERELC